MNNPNPNLIPCSTAVGLMKGDGLYLSKRLNTKTFSGLWQFAGGKLEDNELPIYGAIREVEEETGLKIDYSRLEYKVGIVGDPHFGFHGHRHTRINSPRFDLVEHVVGR